MPERTCRTCVHLSIGTSGELWNMPVCHAPLPMWCDDGDRHLMHLDTDATHCAAYAANEARDA